VNDTGEDDTSRKAKKLPGSKQQLTTPKSGVFASNDFRCEADRHVKQISSLLEDIQH
jgi:hypothetical protein